MSELTIYHLDAPGVFHFGARSVEQEETGVHFPSDSLFSALLTAWMELGQAPEELTNLFPRQETDNNNHTQVFFDEKPPPFRLTSLFPRAGALRFYPALSLNWLLSKKKLAELHQAHRLKGVKKIQFISEKLFKKTLAGEWLDAWLPAEKTPYPTDQGIYLQGGALWLSKDEITLLPPAMQKKPKNGDHLEHLKALRQANVWQTDKTPRVTVDRISSASQIFHTGRLRYSKDCGFWFAIQWTTSNTQIVQGIHNALALLADSGLGAERNAGYGYFSLEQTESSPFPPPQPGDFFVTLSRYHPRPAEIPDAFSNEQNAYRLISVAGWLRSPVEAAQRRRRLWLFEAGSILQQADTVAAPGNLVDVRPVYQDAQFSHPVWRYGLAFPVKIHPAGGAK